LTLLSRSPTLKPNDAGDIPSMTRQVARVLRRFPQLLRLPFFAYSRLQARYTVGVVAVLLDGQGRVLLVEHAYHPRCPWGLPGGWLDDNETPQAAILRELHEELQLQAQVCRVLLASKTVARHIDLAFLCRAQSDIGALSHEVLGYAWHETGPLPALLPFHRRAIAAALEPGFEHPLWAGD